VTKEFKIIDCVNYIYIANKDRWSHTLNKYLFDGKKPEETNNEYWYKLSKIPEKVTVKKPNERINKRYELKAGYAATELMPRIITMEMYSTDEYDDIMGCYTLKYDEVDGGYEEIEFTIDNIYTREDYTFVPNTYYAETDLITQIEYPEEAYQDKPCKLGGKQMLEIIRAHVKANIDTAVATITSDYDFHFEVKKKIALADPYSIMVDTNNSWINKRRKPKWVERMISAKEEVIINFKEPGGRDYGKDCVVAPSIIGENYEDLKNKVEKYLNELMDRINKKYCECPQCRGWGIVEVEDE
jgi:hypothetical protein